MSVVNLVTLPVSAVCVVVLEGAAVGALGIAGVQVMVGGEVVKDHVLFLWVLSWLFNFLHLLHCLFEWLSAFSSKPYIPTLLGCRSKYLWAIT